jgi:hypothetical protein
MKRILRIAAIIGLASVAISASAGQFHTLGSGTGIDIADNIKDLVSEKFTAKYPASKYTIHVIYDFQVYTDGGGVGFSVAGVVPRPQKNDKWFYTPDLRFVSTRRVVGQSINSYEKNDMTIQVIRSSIEFLMAECDKLPKCDILNHN